MNHPAASDGYQSENFKRPKGRGIEPSPAAGGLKLFFIQTVFQYSSDLVDKLELIRF